MACKDIAVCLGHILILSHRFRWVYCQLEVLRQCFPSSVRGVLAELPESLDETYERILQQIPKPIRVHAHRLLQCLVVAARPLNVEELAEVLAIDFSGTGMTPAVDENLRWEDKERAVLSACSSLIIIVQDWRSDSPRVQFSHFSVKEFLTSDRLAASTVDTLSCHHIRLEAAHMIMAQVCLSVLLRLDDHMDSQTIRNYPLSNYAGKHFGDHVEFENVISSINNGVDKLLDRDGPHFYTWVWLQIGDWDPKYWHNSKIDQDSRSFSVLDALTPEDHTMPRHPPRLTPLYYVAALGHLCLAHRLILECSQDLDVKDDKGCTPLHIAVLAGKEEVSQLLIEHSVDLNIEDINHRAPLHMAAYRALPKATRMLLERGGPLKARLNARDKNSWMPLHLASARGYSGIAALLLKFGAEVDAQDEDGMTPLHLASQDRHHFLSSEEDYQNTETAQQLLEHGASAHVRNKNGQTPLHLASRRDLFSIVALLLKFGADVDAQDNDAMTPLQLGLQGLSSYGSKTAQLLLEHGASVHVRDKNGQMPLHLASYYGFPIIVGLLLKYGADVDVQDNDAMPPLLLVLPRLPSGDGCKATQQLLEHGASAHVRNKNGQTPLHIASHHELFSIVALLLKSGADVDAQDNAAMTPLHWVLQSLSSDGFKIAQLLLEHGASVHVRDKNGQMPLHLASRRDFPTIVGLLLKYGADVDAQDNAARTPLHWVSNPFSGDGSKTAQLLLEHGASVHVRDRNPSKKCVDAM